MRPNLISVQKSTAIGGWKAFAWLLFILLAHTAHPQAQSPFSGLPFTRNFQPGDYRGGIQNWAIAQNRFGLIYIANNFGLLEFDGDQWQTYGVRNGTKVRSVAIDARGRIYV
ncbi:hypothetical protein KK062_26875, partial [Fulvivirgaceae bacterium PWU5]